MSLELLEDHRRTWNAKPVLADVYGMWFEALLATRGSSPHRVLELGAGPGFSEYARRRRPDLSWIAADVVAAPWTSCTIWPGPVRSSRKRRACSPRAAAWP
jgi:hypothetical protein